MSMRTSETLLALLLLGACSRETSDAPNGQASNAQKPKQAVAGVPADNRIQCRTAGQSEMQLACTAEQKGQLLTLRNPDGGFRRFQLVPDGRGLVSADGAAQAQVRILSPREIEVSVDGNVYRLPARMVSGAE